MVSRTEVILFARQALLPAKAYPFSKFPLKALYKAVTIQYGLRDISHVLIQLKGPSFRLLDSRLYFLKETAMDGSSGHADGTFDDLYVLLLGLYIGLFEGFRGIAFRGGNEPGS